MLSMLLGLACGSAVAPPRIEPVPGDPARIVVWSETDDVHLRVQGRDSDVAVRVEATAPGTYRLVPLVPLRAGLTYEVYGSDHRVLYTVAAPPDRDPVAVRIYPSTTVLPANHLKFTLRFSQPMSSPPDLLTRQIQLVDEATGQAIETAFAHTPLWTPDDRQLTVILHPGRQKKDIGFSQGLGPVIQAGGAYTLRVASTLEDSQGRPLSVQSTKSFTVGPADHTRPDPSKWRVDLPIQPHASLIVRFDEPLDAAMIPHAFRVTAPHGTLEVQVQLGPEERSVSLFPEGGWPTGPLRLERVGRVEDLAANTPERLFEVLAGTPPASVEPFGVDFSVGPR